MIDYTDTDNKKWFTTLNIILGEGRVSCRIVNDWCTWYVFCRVFSSLQYDDWRTSLVIYVIQSGNYAKFRRIRYYLHAELMESPHYDYHIMHIITISHTLSHYSGTKNGCLYQTKYFKHGLVKRCSKTKIEQISHIQLTKDLYSAHEGELSGVFCEYFGEN